MSDEYRKLPSVEQIVEALAGLAGAFPQRVIVAEARRVLGAARARIRAGGRAPEDAAGLVRESLERLARPSLVKVINATGVILHTNLGRAPLAGFTPAGPYSNLEYDLAAGKRGRRDEHTGGLLERLLGRPAMAVNNGAAALWLALHELAAGGEVIVSRGELIEIGDGFRIPEIMQRSGARLVEVGTTNKTRIEDYANAITPATRVLLRVHPSNFRMSGFTGRPALEELAALARERSLPLYEDLGSGCLIDLAAWGVDEPTVARSFQAGVDLVSFSGDKLLGGPQAGILAGNAELVARLRRNPMFRALRLDKLQVQALEHTARLLLFERFDEHPVLRALRTPLEELERRARAIAAACGGEAVATRALLGGGSTPEQELPSWGVALAGDAAAIERRLRADATPVVARIEDSRLIADLRAVAPEQDAALAAALKRAR